MNPDGTFKSAEELRALYEPLGITKDKDIVVYCRIAERSSHSWFVLKYLLGYPHVKNYDGSWTEWGNLVGVPIAKGEGRATSSSAPLPPASGLWGCPPSPPGRFP